LGGKKNRLGKAIEREVTQEDWYLRNLSRTQMASLKGGGSKQAKRERERERIFPGRASQISRNGRRRPRRGVKEKVDGQKGGGDNQRFGMA